ncbi:hypothetical protein NL676_007298 [Syzygium grande]|nr:hypothetical protein NL676_007298 [Syzygium grande]
MGNEEAFDLLPQDDVFLSSLIYESEDDMNEKKVTPRVLDSEYAQELQFQEVSVVLCDEHESFRNKYWVFFLFFSDYD